MARLGEVCVIKCKKISCRANDIYSVFLFCKAYVYVSIPPCTDTDAQSAPSLTGTETSRQGTDQATERDLILGGWREAGISYFMEFFPAP